MPFKKLPSKKAVESNTLIIWNQFATRELGGYYEPERNYTTPIFLNSRKIIIRAVFWEG